MNNTVLIYGSCVSRDPFDHPILRNSGIKIEAYLSKSGIVSQASPPLKKEITVPSGADFLSRMVKMDALKLAADQMKQHKADWLILDFIDDRLPLIRVDDTYFTASRGFEQSQLARDVSGERIDPISPDFFPKWASSFSKFAEYIKEAGFNGEKIILHRSWWARLFLENNKINLYSKDVLQNCHRNNVFLKSAYAEVKKHFPKCRDIEIPSNLILSDAKHKWGADPYHYVREYNEFFCKKIISIINKIEMSNIKPISISKSISQDRSIVNRRMQPEVSIYGKDEKRDPIVRDYGITLPYITHYKERVDKFKDTEIIFDSSGVPRNLFRWGGPYYYSVTIGHHGLSCISRYIIDKSPEDLNGAAAVTKWLLESQADNGAWPVEYDHDWFPPRCKELKAPWPSAMGQGLCISFLARAAALDLPIGFAKETLIRAAERALGPYAVSVDQGGVRASFLGKYPWFEEYPTDPHSFVLNGFIYSILGPYDLYCANSNKEAIKLYKDGIRSLKIMLPMFDLGRSSAYDLTHITTGKFPPNIARGSYHFIHVQLLSVLNHIESGAFSDVVERWNLYLSGWGAMHN